MTEAISEQEAGQQKQLDAPEAVAAAKKWRSGPVFANQQAATAYLNSNPPQGAGEVSATYNFATGEVALFVYW
jgi:hypothetical protein